MPDLELAFAAAVEPLVAELAELRRELGAIKAAPPIADQVGPLLAPIAAQVAQALAGLAELGARPLARDVAAELLAPIAAELAAVGVALGDLQRHRLDVPAWAPGVYRQGVIVQAFHGQYFEAVSDTAAEPGEGPDWRRLGSHGFRYRGLAIEGADYAEGDLVARDGAMMLQTGGRLVWLTMRGKPGPRGIPGAAGKDGTPGAPGAPGGRGEPGANLVKLEAEGGVLWGTGSDGKRSPIAINGGG